MGACLIDSGWINGLGVNELNLMLDGRSVHTQSGKAESSGLIQEIDFGELVTSTESVAGSKLHVNTRSHAGTGVRLQHRIIKCYLVERRIEDEAVDDGGVLNIATLSVEEE